MHLLRDFQAPQAFDLPLRRAGPHRVRAPHDVVGAQAFDQLAHHGRAQARFGQGALGKDLAQIAVHVFHAVLLRDVGQVGDPIDAPGLLKLIPARFLGATGEAKPRVVNDEVQLREVFRRFAHVAHVGVFQKVGKLLGGGGREQAFVHTHIGQAGFGFAPLDQFFIKRVEQFFVVQVPRVARQVFVGVVANGVALERIGFQGFVVLLGFFQPARHAGHEDGVREHALAARLLVDMAARLRLHLVGQKPVTQIF